MCRIKLEIPQGFHPPHLPQQLQMFVLFLSRLASLMCKQNEGSGGGKDLNASFLASSVYSRMGQETELGNMYFFNFIELEAVVYECTLGISYRQGPFSHTLEGGSWGGR